ncbi:hypothetical protein F2Q69_00009690 [Brassica cretica]|uniref:Uncharacterized protein n=1 Tax=Brassica cretica TaxID=69181 RepID=A0A8S9PC61_BRACR|nr:hypothetical protein F2Q69_00009690 [Brassica cretica]
MGCSDREGRPPPQQLNIRQHSHEIRSVVSGGGAYHSGGCEEDERERGKTKVDQKHNNEEIL